MPQYAGEKKAKLKGAKVARGRFGGPFLANVPKEKSLYLPLTGKLCCNAAVLWSRNDWFNTPQVGRECHRHQGWGGYGFPQDMETTTTQTTERNKHASSARGDRVVMLYRA